MDVLMGDDAALTTEEAAQRVREEPDADLASIAAELGYANHANLTRDFQAVLGIAPRTYRSEANG